LISQTADDRDLRLSASFWQPFSTRVAAADAPVIVMDAAVDARMSALREAGTAVSACAGFPLRTEHGEPVGVFGVADVHPRDWAPGELLTLEDVAGAVEADVALDHAARQHHQAQTRLRAVLEGAHDAYVSIDAAGVVTQWNASADRLFGHSTAQALGRRVAELIIPERLRAAHAAGLALVAEGAPSALAGRRLELVAVDRAGREFPVEMTLQVDATGAEQVFHAFLHDITGRNAAQQELEHERTFLQALLESLDSGVAACGADGRLALFNRAMRGIHHADQRPLPTGEWAAAYHLYGPDGRTALEPDQVPLARGFAGERVDGQQVVVRAPGMPARRYLANARPIDAADGHRLGAIAVLHDITDRHRSEVLQKAQLAVARVLADAEGAEQAATGTVAAVATALGWACGEFWQADPDTDAIARVGTWTLPGHDLSDVTGDELFTLPRGRGLAGIVWDRDAELWIPEVADDARTVARREQARRAGLHTAIGLPVRSDDRVLGVLLFFSSRVEEPDEDLMGMLDGVCAHLGRHIERRRAETLALALTAARRDFDRVISQVNDYVWTVEVHPGGSVMPIYASPDGSGVFGDRLPTDADMAATMVSRVHPDDRSAFAAFQEDLAAGRSTDVEVRLNGVDGLVRWVWTRAVPRIENGRHFVDGISTNVTERRHLAEQREQLLTDQQDQNRQLRDLDRMKDELVALVSHELRNPLAVIRGYSEMMLDDQGLGADHRHVAGVIDRHSAHMQGLVDDLLDLARFDAGQLSIDLRPVAMTRMIHESVDGQQHAARAKRLTITVDVPRWLPVHADPLRLRQVLDNLLSNAVKYTPDGGTVAVSARQEPAAGRDPATGEPGRAGVVIRVADTGIGIPAEQYPHLFERFFRASTAVSHGIKGTGLGLAITKAIVDAHHGTISAEPTAGGGTTFTIAIPDTAV
jgi:PAS domain S-box-containing protein